MHIILGLLGAIVTILILLNRLADAGIDLGGLNPYLWRRRRKWRKQYEGDPIYKLSDPMEVAALLMVAVAKSDGDMSSEEKKEILHLFQEEFHLNRRDAADLMVSSVYLLKSGAEVKTNLQKIVQPSLDKFSVQQANSTIELVNKVAQIDSERSELKEEIVEDIKRCLAPATKLEQKWG